MRGGDAGLRPRRPQVRPGRQRLQLLLLRLLLRLLLSGALLSGAGVAALGDFAGNGEGPAGTAAGGRERREGGAGAPNGRPPPANGPRPPC